MYDDIIKRHRPRGWRIAFSRRRDKAADKARKLYMRKRMPALKPGMSNVIAICDNGRKTIYAPHVVDEFTLQILLHECGHVHMKHFTHGKSCMHKEEWEAERWSMEIMRMEGIAVTPLIKRGVRRYIKLCLDHDESHGVPIHMHIERYAKVQK